MLMYSKGSKLTIWTVHNWPVSLMQFHCAAITHLRLNKIPYTIYRKSQILILSISGHVIQIFLETKWLNYMYLQTVETLIRCHILWHLIWVCTVCQLPFWGSVDYNGLNRKSFSRKHILWILIRSASTRCFSKAPTTCMLHAHVKTKALVSPQLPCLLLRYNFWKSQNCIQSNLSGRNTFGTLEICLRYR